MRRALPLGYCLLCGSAFAQAGVSWQYTAPPECPSEQEFRDQVRGRLLREPRASDLATAANASSGVRVEVRLEPSERRASLLLEGPGAPLVERSVEGDSCAELASGLALITALAFGGPEEPTDTAATETPPADPAATAYPITQSPPAEGPIPIAAAAKPDREASIDDPTPAPSSTRLGLEAGGGGWLNSWSVPNGALGADAFLRLAPAADANWSLRLAGLYGFGATSVGDRRAEFTFLGARTEGCPFSRRLPLSFSGEACVAVDLGALRGRGDAGSALLEGTSQTVFWAAAVVAARLRARWGKRFSLEGQAELGLPLVRHEFWFEAPRQLVFEVPAVGFGAGLGLGVEFL